MGKFIPFGEWLPDLPSLNNPGATVAKNVLPDIKSYRPFQKLTTYSNALASRCQGAIIARDATGNYYNFAGDSVRLYSLSNLTWNNVTRLAGGDYQTAAADYWEFTQFGNLVIGVNGSDANFPQAITLGAANFANLVGDPPRAKHIASVRDFVVIGNISATATEPQMVRWCAINNAGSWTPDAATMADFQNLPGDGGHVQKVVGGEYGVIFQERAIYRMDWAGSPLVFQFNKVHTNIGTPAPQSVVSYRNFVFFLSEDGFYMFDGSNVKPIGQNKVDRTFFNDLDGNFTYRINAAVDPIRKIVTWAYPSVNAINGNPDRVLVYNWGADRWSRIEDLQIELMFRHATTALTLEGLDATNPNIDLMQVPFDSQQWIGGSYQLGAFDSQHRLSIFNGSAMPATVETGEYQFNRDVDGLTYVTEVRPVTEGFVISASIAIGTRIKNSESAVYAVAVAPGSSGFASVRSTARFHRFRMETENGSTFDHLQGLDILATEDGIR
jgi:hypothetical protein